MFRILKITDSCRIMPVINMAKNILLNDHLILNMLSGPGYNDIIEWSLLMLHVEIFSNVDTESLSIVKETSLL